VEECARGGTGHRLIRRVTRLRSVFKWLAILTAVCVIGAGSWFSIDRYRYRFVRTDNDLVKLLPPGDLTTFYMNIAALRRAGLLHLLSGITPAATEKDYADFVQSTQFDYARDMDALAGGFAGNQIFFLIRGRFDWDKLRQFAVNHGGTCAADACRAPATKPRRWVNFLRIQPDTLALAIGENSTAADMLRPPARRLQDSPPGDPVWVSVSPSLMKDPTGLPKPLRIFAISLQPANSVLLSAGQAEHGNEAFTVQLEAAFPDAPSADTTCKQLQIQTRMLRLELARENHEPNPADLTGLLTAGAFQVGNTRVFGTWPVRKELLSALE
jgi:hypothetical protein